MKQTYNNTLEHSPFIALDGITMVAIISSPSLSLNSSLSNFSALLYGLFMFIVLKTKQPRHGATPPQSLFTEDIGSSDVEMKHCIQLLTKSKLMSELNMGVAFSQKWNQAKMEQVMLQSAAKKKQPHQDVPLWRGY